MNVVLSPTHQRILQEQSIGEGEPGSILRDFEVLLDFVGKREIKVSGIHQLLSMNALAELNARLSNPLRILLRRPQQKSYPHINGLYLLLRASGLSLIEVEGKQPLLTLDQEALASWRGLNLTERYFTLFEAWLVRGEGEIIGDDRDPLGAFFKCSTFMESIPDRGLKVAGNRQAGQLTIPYQVGTYNLALLELFGCVSVEEGQPEAGKSWVVARVERTPFGEALFKLLSRHRLAAMRFELGEDEIEEATASGTLQPVLQTFFPEWRRNLELPEASFVDGLYVFKVSLAAKVWRRIAIPAALTLDGFSGAILRAFDFDDDHLYRFSYRDRFGVTVHVNHPYIEEPPSTDEVAVGGILLRPGVSMEYLFDFGDRWRFDVKLERIDPADARIRPKILEEHDTHHNEVTIWQGCRSQVQLDVFYLLESCRGVDSPAVLWLPSRRLWLHKCVNAQLVVFYLDNLSPWVSRRIRNRLLYGRVSITVGHNVEPEHVGAVLGHALLVRRQADRPGRSADAFHFYQPQFPVPSFKLHRSYPRFCSCTSLTV